MVPWDKKKDMVRLHLANIKTPNQQTHMYGLHIGWRGLLERGRELRRDERLDERRGPSMVERRADTRAQADAVDEAVGHGGGHG